VTIKDARKAVLVSIALTLATASAAGAQSIDDFFNPQVLQEVRLWVNSRDLRLLKERYTEDTYYTADFEWRGIRVRNVGIRNRGLGSRNPIKLGLRVEFDHYAASQSFLGLRNLVLRNLWQDPSLVHEGVSMAFFARMGQPASRESFAKLYINNVYSGVYGLVENVDPQFLQRTVGNSDGYLFEYRYKSAFYATDPGDTLSEYRTIFEPEAPHKRDSDSALYPQIRNLFREANRPVDEAWRGSVDRYLNLGQFITHLAIENFIAEFDGFLGYVGMNNFYLYRTATSDQHRIIAWDKSEAFYSTDYPIFLRADENVLTRAIFSFADLRTQYLDTLVEAAARANDVETEGGPSWLEQEITRQSDLIREAVYADTYKQFTNEQFEADVERLKAFARQRSSFVTAEVAKARTP
jgi:spore coat protein CotH